MKGYSLYGLASEISIVVRQFVLPNPFDCFGDKAWLINLLAEPLMQLISYLLVGLVYKKGSMPLLGSILFLLTYAALTGFLRVLGLFQFAWWWVLLTIAIAAGLVFVLYRGWLWLSERRY